MTFLARHVCLCLPAKKSACALKRKQIFTEQAVYTYLFKNKPSSLKEKKGYWAFMKLLQYNHHHMKSITKTHFSYWWFEELKNIAIIIHNFFYINEMKHGQCPKVLNPPSIDHSVIHLFKGVKHWNIDITGYWLIIAGCYNEKI